MSTDRDTTRIVRSWLEVGATALPDRVLDAVLDQLPATPQRRSWGPARRFLDMNTSAKLAIAAAAVLVVALASFYLLPRGGGLNGGPGPGLSPSPTPTSTPSPTPSRRVARQQRREAGTYVISINDRPVTFSVPAGWTSSQNFIYKPVAEPAMVLVTFGTVTARGRLCHSDGPLSKLEHGRRLNALLAQKGLSRHRRPMDPRRDPANGSG